MIKRELYSGQRIGVFVDVQNLFYSAKTLHNAKIDFKKLLDKAVGPRILTRAVAYIVQKAGINQTAFIEALRRSGFEVKSKDLKIRADGTAKGDWDMGIAIDGIAIARKLDTIVLVSGDGDFVPLVEMLKAEGCRVEVISFRRSTASELIHAANLYTEIDEKLLMKDRS